MPEIFREGGFRFFFYSNEGHPREPLHVHVRRGGESAKIWVTPNVALAESSGFDAQELRRVLALARRRRVKSRMPGMSILAKSVNFDEDSMWVELSDGRTLGVPLACYPRLLDASPEQRESVEISGAGLHWEALDEDISVEGLLAGRGDQTRFGRERRPSSTTEGVA